VAENAALMTSRGIEHLFGLLGITIWPDLLAQTVARQTIGH
jgi:hypothetical protein